MTSRSSSPTIRLEGAVGRLAAALVSEDVSQAVVGLDDDVLLAALAEAAEVRNALDVIVAALGAEVERRSARELGYAGLAQRKGHRNATSLVQNITGQSRGDVGRSFRAGEELISSVNVLAGGGSVETDAGGGAADATESAPVVPRWLSTLREALKTGRVSTAQFHAIRTGLGEPPAELYPDLDPEFVSESRANAVDLLLEDSAHLPVEELRAAARIARDRLDPVGVTLRFEERFAARSFRTWVDETGQQHARISFDDDAAAWVHTILQASLRPRRGPRFVGEGAKDRAAEAHADERTNEQLQYDTVMAVVRTGAAADPTQAFGDRQPGIRILVEATSIAGADERGGMRVTGVGHLEDGGHALPGGVVETYLCDAGSIPILRDEHGRPLDVGREQRLFTRKQRMGIAARDGACMWPGCVAPISQCEYHHVDHWWEHGGGTNVDDGVPLCRNCHMRLHNQRWRIIRERDRDSGADMYWLHSPPDPLSGVVSDPVRLVSRAPHRFAAA